MKIGEYEVVAVSNDEVKVGCQAVTREQVKDVLRVMDEWSNLKLGDYVKVKAIGSDYIHKPSLVGLHGKVAGVSRHNTLAVEFAMPCDGAGCSGEGISISRNHGAWFKAHELQKVN